MAFKMFRWQKEVFLESKAKFNILPAGRRSGKTQGGCYGAIISAAQGYSCLWVDTINGNIERYYERYFLPALQANELTYSWNAQKKILKIEDGFIDFRSADAPESIEGFGYHKIYLNEAGIILNNDYLYTNTILPMLIDFAESQLYAFGTPKGKLNKKGEKHRFFALWEKCEEGQENYFGRKLSTYSNPLVNEEGIAELEKEIRDISEEAVLQELFAEFVEESSNKVFGFNELDRFQMDAFKTEGYQGRVGAIDPADEGNDYFSFPLGYLIGKRFFVTDWLFTQENTNFTTPASASLTRQNKLDYLAIETNNHGSVIYKDIENEISGTDMIPINSSAKKHSRIVQNAGFIRNHFVFRDDYAVGSDYDKAMKQLFQYTKDGKKVAHDDAPDSVALLAAVLRDLYEYVWY